MQEAYQILVKSRATKDHRLYDSSKLNVVRLMKPKNISVNDCTIFKLAKEIYCVYQGQEMQELKKLEYNTKNTSLDHFTVPPPSALIAFIQSKDEATLTSDLDINQLFHRSHRLKTK